MNSKDVMSLTTGLLLIATSSLNFVHINTEKKLREELEPYKKAEAIEKIRTSAGTAATQFCQSVGCTPEEADKYFGQAVEYTLKDLDQKSLAEIKKIDQDSLLSATTGRLTSNALKDSRAKLGNKDMLIK